MPGVYAISRASAESAPNSPYGIGSFSGSPPWTGTRYSLLNRSFSLVIDVANSSDLPSGYQSISRSAAGWCVTRRGMPPAAGIT